MEKNDLQKQLHSVEGVVNSLSGVLRDMKYYGIVDDKLSSVIAEYLSAYHLKAANLALYLKNLE